MHSFRWLVLVAALCALRVQVSAFTLTLDYSLDSTGFFASNPTAKAAVDAAAADLSVAVLGSLDAIPTSMFTGTNAGTTASVTWTIRPRNPVTDSPFSISSFNIAANSMTVFVGMRALTGSTLGIGGHAGVGISLGGSGSESLFVGAANNAYASSNAVMTRDGGPIMGSLSGTMTLGAASAPYTLSYGALAGSISFDNDRNNNGFTDSDVELAAAWHFNHATAVSGTKSDFYSVALHEFMHAMGVGSSDSWDALVSGTNWLGSNVQTLNGGSGMGLVDADGSHLRSGLVSTRITDGVAQEAAMDPSLTQGTRKYLTAMDLAFLQDIGWLTIPEPAVTGLITFTGVWVLLKRRRIRKS